MSALLEVEGLRVRLPVPSGHVTVVDGIDYRVEPGEVFGIAGESGSGKTMSVLALMGLLPPGGDGRAAARSSQGATCSGCLGGSCGGSAAASWRWCSRIR